MKQIPDWTRVLIPQDARAQIRHGHQTVPLPCYPSRECWEARVEHLRRRILVSAGLWPMPDKSPLRPHVTGLIEHADYTIENVYFESWPGFYVTGNLYRPVGKSGSYPGIACPHGHWEHGRLENGERGSVPARCITFARHGCVAFAYDMIGYNDSGRQVSGADGRDPHTGFFNSPQEHLWGISLMGLQLWNSIRVVDLLCSLPYVDAQRIACTGASGGGTQTFMLMAVDDRVQVAAPVNMISAHFQGGCMCENMPNLRLDCSNVDFAAMMAPRPLLMVSATGDWTCNTPEVEYPAVKEIYRLYGGEERVASVQVDAPHNYNRASREAVYAWFGRWISNVQEAAQCHEQTFQLEPSDKLLVFPDGRLPADGVTPQQLTTSLIRDAKAQVQSLEPMDAATLQAYRQVMGTAYRYALNAVQPGAGDLQVENVQTEERAGYRLEGLILGQRHVGERMPALLFVPQEAQGGALVVHPGGKAGLVDGPEPTPLVAGLLARKLMVLAVDVFGTGELELAKRDLSADPLHTFNRTDTALRVQDVLTGIAYLRTRTHTTHLVGLGEAGVWCLLARGLASGVSQTIVDADQFACDDDEAWVERAYVPQVRRAGDLRTAAALTAPGSLFLHNVSPSFPTGWYRRIYGVVGAPEALHIQLEQIGIRSMLRALRP